MVKSTTGDCCIIGCKWILVITLFETCEMNCCIADVVMGCNEMLGNAEKLFVLCRFESDFIGELLLFLLCSTTFGLWFASGSCSCLYSLMVCA